MGNQLRTDNGTSPLSLGEALDQRIGAIERMLTALRSDASDLRRRIYAIGGNACDFESRITSLEIRAREDEADAAAIAMSWDREPSSHLVPIKQVERWERIEKAAKEFIHELSLMSCAGDQCPCWKIDSLRSALDGEGE